jgi:hypothetical protein
MLPTSVTAYAKQARSVTCYAPLGYSTILKMEAYNPPKHVNFYQTIWCYIPEDSPLPHNTDFYTYFCSLDLLILNAVAAYRGEARVFLWQSLLELRAKPGS